MYKAMKGGEALGLEVGGGIDNGQVMESSTHVPQTSLSSSLV